MPPFQYSQYQNPYVQSISSLLEAPGQIEAQRAQAVGNAWGGAVQNAGQAIMGAIQQQMDPRRKLAQAQFEGAQLENAKAKQQQSDLVALDKAMSTPGGLDAVLNATPGHLRSTVLKSYEEAQKLGNDAKTAAENARKVQAEHFGYLGAQIKQQNYDPAAALAALHQARETYSDDPSLLKQIDAMRMGVIERPESIKGIADNAILGSSYKDMLKPERPIEHDPTKALISPTGQVITPAEAKPAAAPKEYEVTVPGPNGPIKKLVTADELRGGVKEYQKPAENPERGDDAKAIANSIIDGKQPPTVQGLYRLAGPVRAELAKQGYDMTTANLDWEATKKHLSTLNGAQQTRLRQAIVTATDSLDVIQNLADKWDSGRFPILNRANLALAKGGAYGKDAASIATQLEGQITDVTSELGNVYMGGNSPTDHALKLAGKNLAADWDRKVLTDMIKLARTNLQIRNNSITTAGAITSTSQQQQPEPAKPAAAAPIKVGGFTVTVK